MRGLVTFGSWAQSWCRAWGWVHSHHVERYPGSGDFPRERRRPSQKRRSTVKCQKRQKPMRASKTCREREAELLNPIPWIELHLNLFKYYQWISFCLNWVLMISNWGPCVIQGWKGDTYWDIFWVFVAHLIMKIWAPVNPSFAVFLLSQGKRSLCPYPSFPTIFLASILLCIFLFNFMPLCG